MLAVPISFRWTSLDSSLAARYPGTAMIQAMSYVLSLLCLKLVGMRRVSHVDDLAADMGAGLFASTGAALPKATALSTYSYRLSHPRQASGLSSLPSAARCSSPT